MTLSDDGTARIWDAATGHHQMLLAGHNRRIRCGGWSFDGRRVVTGDWERARIWDASTGNELLSIRHDGSVYQCSFNAEGTRLLSEDGKLKVWDLASGKLLFAIDPPKDDDFDQVEFTLEGSTILARYDDAWKLKLLDAHTGAELGELGALFAEIDDTDISSDSSRLAALSVLEDTSNIRIWDLKTREQLHLLTVDSEVNHVVFSPDGAWIASAGDDGKVRVWEVESGLIVASFDVGARVRRVLFSPVEPVILTYAGDRIRRWRFLPLTAQTLVDRARSFVTGRSELP